MDLRRNIESLRDEFLSELATAHDYYVNSVSAWRIVHVQIENGSTVRIRNFLTGTITTEQELPGLAQTYINSYLASATLQQFISLFEDFLFGLMRLWLLAFPYRLKDRKVPGEVILSAPSLDAVKEALVDSRLIELRYRKVSDWFAFLDGLVKLGCPTAEEVEQLAEIKAARDVLVHNRGIVNEIYEQRAGPRKRFSSGEKLEVPEPYHRQSWELVRKVVADIAAAALAKAPA